MKSIKYLPINERPREKLLFKGAKHLSDIELLAIILGRGSIKSDVLSLSRKVVQIIDKKGPGFLPSDIGEINGIGKAKATTIAAALEFVRRRIKPEGLKVTLSADVLPLLQHYRDRKQEYFLCVSLNGANEVMAVRVITIGLVNKTQVHPREIFSDVISERATSVIVAHNHPSGSLTPSAEDMRLTRQIAEASKVLGINFLDHIIFNSKGYYSFEEHKVL